jgi:nucleoside 2-deoxyribosyltransferase
LGSACAAKGDFVVLLSCYGAGPDIFFPDAREIYRRKVEICAKRGIRLRVPIDNEVKIAGPEAAVQIYRANRAMMSECDLCIANLSPFRGPSADDGTSFEVGFFDALGRPVFAYSNASGSLMDRTRAFQVNNPDAFDIEDFGLAANLMLPLAVLDRGGLPMFTPEGGNLPHDDLSVFERLVDAVAERCAPLATLRQQAMEQGEDPAAIASALHQRCQELDGRSPLEVALAEPGTVSDLARLIRRQG